MPSSHKVAEVSGVVDAALSPMSKGCSAFMVTTIIYKHWLHVQEIWPSTFVRRERGVSLWCLRVCWD